MTDPLSALSRPVSAAEAIDAATRHLTAAGSETPRLDAEILLRHVLGLDRTGLFLRLPAPLDPASQARFRGLVERRAAGQPAAYLVGEREFMGLALRVGPGVLVPRPETEILVEWALRRLADTPARLVVDVGTGSGAIAVALARLLPAAWSGLIVAADVSAAALRFAAENRARHDARGRVRLVRGDLATWCAGGVDLLLANLPYLRPDQGAANPHLAAEPAVALLGGADGLALVRRLADDLPRLLAPGGAAGFEIDPSQAEAVVRLLSTRLPEAAVDLLRDLAGHERHVVATLPIRDGRGGWDRS